MLSVKVKYLDKNMPRLYCNDIGDWIDLRVCDVLNLPKFRFSKADNGWYIYKDDVILVNFGICVELPQGYEAIITPRSSLFKKHGLILTNSIGIIDNSYNGDNDVWKGMFYCLKTSKENIIYKYERIAQFRLLKNIDDLEFVVVDKLNNSDRQGFGSTGMM